jgi:hypothetical protein
MTLESRTLKSRAPFLQLLGVDSDLSLLLNFYLLPSCESLPRSFVCSFFRVRTLRQFWLVYGGDSFQCDERPGDNEVQIHYALICYNRRDKKATHVTI